MNKLRKKQFAELGKLILAGAEKRPQCFNDYFWGERSCAMGAAYEALTGQLDASPSQIEGVLKDAFPVLRRRGPVCPLCGQTRNRVMGLLLHLNDQHRWSRERIAALLLLGPSKASLQWLAL